MPLSPGTARGSFEISALLCVGAMGEVYRARDTKPGRGVAIEEAGGGGRRYRVRETARNLAVRPVAALSFR